MSDVRALALDVALDAVRRAGAVARWAFEDRPETWPKGNGFDVVGKADLEAERRIIDRIRLTFPDHAILAEESGWTNKGADWTWIVDPLDGTHNYAIGLPLYGCAVALHHNGAPVLSVIHDSHRDRTMWALPNKGVRLQSEMRATKVAPEWNATELAAADVSLITGYGSAKTDLSRQLARRLTQVVKRPHKLWATCTDWMLLATGGIDAIILVDDEPWDALPGMHIALEAGADIRTFDGEPWKSWNFDRVNAVVSSPQVIDAVLEVVADEGDVARSIANAPTTTPVAEDLKAALLASWASDTAYSEWSTDKPSVGQCAVTAFIVQEELGGDLLWTTVDGEGHVFNQIATGEIIDLTRDQFDDWDPDAVVVTSRFRELSSQSTAERYEKLRERVRSQLSKRAH